MLTWWRHQPLEVKIAGQCAPVLAGVKPSNMLVLENKHIRDVVRTLEGTGLSRRCLYAGNEKNIWLLYRKAALEEIVFRKEEREFLEQQGYADDCLEQMLARLGQRFREYRKTQDIPFPHEMGVFLGYPMADVKGFIKYGEKIISIQATGKCMKMWRRESSCSKVMNRYEAFLFRRRKRERISGRLQVNGSV